VPVGLELPPPRLDRGEPMKSAAEATFALLAVVALTLAFVTMTVACLNILSL